MRRESQRANVFKVKTCQLVNDHNFIIKSPENNSHIDCRKWKFSVDYSKKKKLLKKRVIRCPWIPHGGCQCLQFKWSEQQKKDDDTTNLNIWQLSHFTIYRKKVLWSFFISSSENVSSRQKADTCGGKY